MKPAAVWRLRRDVNEARIYLAIDQWQHHGCTIECMKRLLIRPQNARASLTNPPVSFQFLKINV